jgi:hypothetical protein
MKSNVIIRGNIQFKLRFNTQHGNTDLYWRVFIGEDEYLVRSLRCMVPTESDASFDKKAGVIKFNMAGTCSEFIIDEKGEAFFK